MYNWLIQYLNVIIFNRPNNKIKVDLSQMHNWLKVIFDIVVCLNEINRYS
jgi:hypothetical protein